MISAAIPRGRSIVVLSLAMAAVALIVSPWGNYPVNDDWHYARIVKGLAETGRLHTPIDIASSFAGQAILTAPIVRIFGFSHTILRATTIVVAIGLLWLLDRILKIAGTTIGMRALAAMLVIGNPLFLNVAFSYMTEIYGYACALAGAWIWLRARRHHRSPGAPLLPWRDALVATTLIGASFWIRQLCIVVYPALVGATLFRTYIDGDRARIRSSLPVLAAASLWFLVVVGLYFIWAAGTGNQLPEFGSRMELLRRRDPLPYVVSAFELTVYLTLFLFPFFLLESWRTTRWTRFAVLALCGVAAIWAASVVRANHLSFHHRAAFPFAANVLFDTGVGPITLPGTYFDSLSARPRWPAWSWTLIEWLVVTGTLLWLRVAARGRDEARLSGEGAEIRDFGLLFTASAFVVNVQAFQWQPLDRYFLPCVLGTVIALSARPVDDGRRVWPALLAAVPLLCFTIAGTHDYFRWNDARWAAVDLVAADGGGPLVTDGGYEVNGWLNYDAALSATTPSGCSDEAYYCTDDVYVISMELPPGRTKLAELPVSWWLARGPNIIVSRR